LRLGEPDARLHSYERFFVGTMRSHLQFLELLSVAFSDAMAYSNRDKAEVTIFGFHRTSDLITVGNH